MSSLTPFTVDKPWGNFREFTKNQPSTVKIITVKAGEQLSLQTHKNRSEFWKVLSGTPDITIGEVVTRANPGDEFQIEAEVKHRIGAPVGDIEMLEVATGDFDEEDIERLEDKYGRV
jgi:mannose-6-phosphate isomerase